LQKTLTRAKFEQLVGHLIERTKEPCTKALADAGLKPEQVDEAILVGGSTRIPAVQTMVKKIFGREPNKTVNPDEVVSVAPHPGRSAGRGLGRGVARRDCLARHETLGGVMTS
jgi:molecular chaperone DnaK